MQFLLQQCPRRDFCRSIWPCGLMRLSRPDCSMRDKLAPIKDMWSRWSTHLLELFNPGRDICIDEQLVPFRGRCSFRQYMPSKPVKYGLKIWALCDVYAWRLQVYTGKSASAPREHNQGMPVVLLGFIHFHYAPRCPTDPSVCPPMTPAY